MIDTHGTPRASRRKGPTAIDAAVGRNVRMRRLQRGLSQSQLAKGLGITFQQVQKYEKGTNRIGSGRLVRIAQILEVPVAALLEGATGEAGQSRAALIADRRALRLAQAFATIEDPVFRLSMIELVERLAAVPQQPPRRGRGRKRRRR